MTDELLNAKTETAAAVAAGREMEQRLREPIIVKDDATGVIRLFTPTGEGGWEEDDLDDRAPQPRRITEKVRVVTPAGFVKYVRLFGKKDESIVICKPPMANDGSARFTALLDYHVDRSPSWAGHRCILTLPTTKEWNDWMQHHKKPLDQVEFAQFLEDRIPEIVTPPGAQLVEMARTFEALSDVSFKSVDVARDGSRVLKYEEIIKEVPRADVMPLPQEITIVVAPYEGTAPQAIRARVRFTLQAGVLRLRYELIRPEDALEDAFRAARAEIEDGVADVTRAVIDGSSFIE